MTSPWSLVMYAMLVGGNALPLLTSPWLHNRRLCMRCMAIDQKLCFWSIASGVKDTKRYGQCIAPSYIAFGDVWQSIVTKKKKNFFSTLFLMHLKRSFKSIAKFELSILSRRSGKDALLCSQACLRNFFFLLKNQQSLVSLQKQSKTSLKKIRGNVSIFFCKKPT